MAKGESGKSNKNTPQKAAPKHDDSEIRDLKSRDKNTDFGKIKGGATKKGNA